MGIRQREGLRIEISVPARGSREAGLPESQTCVIVNGFEVDFYWPELPLIVETDGLRYHRTPTQQKKDLLTHRCVTNRPTSA